MSDKRQNRKRREKSALELRHRIISELQEFLSLQSILTAFEAHFMSFVLLPSFHLQQTIQLREYLEHELARISDALRSGLLTETSEIEEEVHRTLEHASFWKSGSAGHYRPTQEQPAHWMKQDDFPDPSDRKDLLKEFKKVVLPRVHADTSETPFEVFQTVYEAYKAKDFLLIAAFVIQFREEDPEQQDLAVPRYPADYTKVLSGLRKRVKKMKDDPTAKRLENQREVLTQLQEQNKEIRLASIREAERVVYLQSCLQNLIRPGTFSAEVN